MFQRTLATKTVSFNTLELLMNSTKSNECEGRLLTRILLECYEMWSIEYWMDLWSSLMIAVKYHQQRILTTVQIAETSAICHHTQVHVQRRVAVVFALFI